MGSEMCIRDRIKTDNAPAAIGTYSQAVQAGDTVYISGQIPLNPNSMEVVADDFVSQAHQVFQNLEAIAVASGSSLANVVKLTVYMVDLSDFSILNEVMAEYINEPYPARAAVQVVALPKDVLVEVDAILYLET